MHIIGYNIRTEIILERSVTTFDFKLHYYLYFLSIVLQFC